MNNLIDRVARYAAQHRLWAPDTRVVAAVSGGSDSVAMVFLLRDLAARGELILAGLAHLHHHIRGADADADAAFCRALAARLEIPAFVGAADVPALAALRPPAMLRRARGPGTYTRRSGRDGRPSLDTGGRRHWSGRDSAAPRANRAAGARLDPQ